MPLRRITRCYIFLSTPSARRATFATGSLQRTIFYFYPRPPRGGRPGSILMRGNLSIISIHALREEGDWCRRWSCCRRFQFLSTPSARRATYRRQQHPADHRISIHALREEGDALCMVSAPARSISIHALREEGDHRAAGAAPGRCYFYPRPPRGGRQTLPAPSTWTA